MDSTTVPLAEPSSVVEDRLLVALEAGRMGTWVYELATGRQLWDRAQYDLLGISSDVRPDRELFLSLVLPEDRPLVAFGPQDLRPGIHHDCEFRIRRGDGTIRWLSAHSMVRFDPHGVPIELVGVNRDITEEKEAQLARAEIEHRLALATDAAQIGIWDWDVQSGAFYYSPLAREIYGFSPAETITYDMLQQRTHPEDYKLIEPALASALDPAVRSRQSYRYRITRADTGEERWLLAHGGAEFSGPEPDARPIRYTGTLQDITEEVRTANILKDEQARLALALSASDLAVWEIDVRTGSVTASAELNKLYGFPPGSRPTLEDFRQRYAPGEAERVTSDIEAALQRGEHSVKFEAKHLWPDGTVKWIAVRAQIYVDPAGAPLRMLGVAMDVSERVASQQRLITTARELQHRVKNSLTIVKSLAVQTLGNARTKEEGIETFSGRLRALATATDLITKGNWEQVPVRQIVAESVRPYATSEPPNFHLHGDDAAVGSQDAVGLGMALHELCTNAVKYGALSADGGSVEIVWRADDDHVSLEWKETGGPAVDAPSTEGFGTKLLRRILSADAGGEVILTFEHGGVCAILRMRKSPTHKASARSLE